MIAVGSLDLYISCLVDVSSTSALGRVFPWLKRGEAEKMAGPYPRLTSEDLSIEMKTSCNI